MLYRELKKCRYNTDSYCDNIVFITCDLQKSLPNKMWLKRVFYTYEKGALLQNNQKQSTRKTLQKQ